MLALGPLGSAQLVKLPNNALFAAHLQLVGDIERIAGDLGVDVARAAAAIERSSGASYAVGLVESVGSARTIAERGGHFLHKDVAAALGDPPAVGRPHPSPGVGRQVRHPEALGLCPPDVEGRGPSWGRTPGMYLVVLRRRGPEWDASLPMEEQSGWPAHASYMDGLVRAGFLVLGGPLADEHRVVLAVDAETEDEVHATLARDPWSGTHLVIDTVEAWTIRLDGRQQ